MDIVAKKTEELVDKASGVIQKGFSAFDKMVFLNESQQDTINTTAATFGIYNKIMSNNIDEIENSISSMTEVKQINETRGAIESLKNQNMQDTARKIAAGENVGIEQMQEFSKNLMVIRRGLESLDTNISMSFNDLVGMYAKQIVSQVNSDKAQESHFRSLLVSMNNQGKYLQEQIRQMEDQKNLDENQIVLLEAHKRDLEKIKKFSSDSAKFSKMGPEGMKENKDAINEVVNQLSNQTFESKMFTTMNTLDNSIQSMSVDSERLNETMNDLTQAQMSGKEVIAGTAMKLKKGAKGMISSMVLSSMGLGGLDEALGISEKLSDLNLFGNEGLFGKKGMLSNIVGTVKGGAAGVKGLMGAGGLGSFATGAAGVVGAGAAGYALGTGINKLIDKIGGEENFLGAAASRAIHGGAEREGISTGDAIKKWGSMSNSVEGIDEALIDIDNFIKTKEKGWTTKAEKQSIQHAKHMAEVLQRKRKKLEAGDLVRDKNKKEVETGLEISIEDTLKSIGVNDESLFPDINGEINRFKTMTDKVNVISTKVMGDQIVGTEGALKPSAVNMEPDFNKKGVVPEEITYLPKVMHDTTNMIIENNKEESKRSREAQKQQTPVIIPPPTAPAPVDLNKSIDDPTLTIFNNDIFG
jgi:hypothetical protein